MKGGKSPEVDRNNMCIIVALKRETKDKMLTRSARVERYNKFSFATVKAIVQIIDVFISCSSRLRLL